MAGLDYAIVDGDGHVQEHDNELLEHMRDPYPTRMRGANFPFFPTLDGYQRDAIQALRGKHPGYVGAKEWIDFMDGNNVESSVLYPTAALGVGMIQDPDWAVTVSRAYNDWLSETHMKASDRLIGVAVLPLQEVEESVKELTRCVEELGMVAAMLPANSADMGIRTHLGDERFWPIYREAERLGVPVAVHGAPSQGLGLNMLPMLGSLMLEHPVALMMQMTGMMMSGLYDEFPKLKVAYLEADTGWVPYMMDRLQVFETLGMTSVSGVIKSGRVYLSCQSGEVGLRSAMDRLSSDIVLYATDYWHEPIEDIVEDLDVLIEREDLSDAEKRKILRDNTIAFYALDAS